LRLKLNNKLILILLLTGFFISSLGFIPQVSASQSDPQVLFDETGPYGKYYTIYNIGPLGASTFANLLTANGFTVSRETEPPLTYDKLKNYDILILMAPERNYTPSEINAIKKYIAEGGGLFLMGDVWGAEDGNQNYAYNQIAQSFGLSFAYNVIVLDKQHNVGFSQYVKITNLTDNPLNTNISYFYLLRSTYISNTGNSDVTAYSDANSWADNQFLTSEGTSMFNEKKESGELSGPLAVSSTMEYGKGRIVFMDVGSFVNSWIYRSNGWKLELNAANWLIKQPTPSSYKTAGLFSPTLADFEYNIIILTILAIILVLGLSYKIRRDKNKDLKPVKTIKNWKYNGLLGLNSIFSILGAILFIPINLFLLDSSQEIYDPYFSATLLILGIPFLFFAGMSIYHIFHRQRISANYSYFNIVILLFFAFLTVFIGDMYAFPMLEIFTLGSIILLIPFLVNLWVMRKYGADLIIEGKEFNRLAKLSNKALPYELHAFYRDSSYIGEGGFGRVFKAKRKDGLEVALKIPKTFDKRSEKIFVSEVSIWQHLNHPNIVQLNDFKILPIPYIEMEYCDESLEHGQKSIEEAVNIVYSVAQGLKYAHSQNIIHGDVKTSNIMIHNGVYKISDWGLSKIKSAESITLSGATPQYAAPEQISHEFGKADERTDIYQLGNVFYELVTDTLPFKGEMSVIYGSILTTLPKIPSEINPNSKKVEMIIMKCLSKDKNDRYASMDELLSELEKYHKDSQLDKTVLFKENDESS
jgi:eukaryotic-like serine/threonine-protein kinase